MESAQEQIPDDVVPGHGAFLDGGLNRCLGISNKVVWVLEGDAGRHLLFPSQDSSYCMEEHSSPNMGAILPEFCVFFA